MFIDYLVIFCCIMFIKDRKWLIGIAICVMARVLVMIF